MLNAQSKTIYKHLIKLTDFFFKKVFQRKFIQLQKFFSTVSLRWSGKRINVFKFKIDTVDITLIRHFFFMFPNICLHTLYFLMSKRVIFRDQIKDFQLLA